MELEKIRNLSDTELVHQEQQAREQLFRLNFQKALGNNEGVKKLRGLKLDIARLKTIARQRELGIAEIAAPSAVKPVAKPAAKAAAEAAPEKEAAPAKKKTAAHKPTAKKAAAKHAKTAKSAKPAKKPAAKKPAAKKAKKTTK